MLQEGGGRRRHALGGGGRRRHALGGGGRRRHALGGGREKEACSRRREGEGGML